jgi:fructose-specific phosphotransferase system IIC component
MSAPSLSHLTKVKQALLNGVSFAIPFIACGGILIASSIAVVPIGPAGPDFSHSPVAQLVLQIGSASFALLLPVLAGYISYALAGKPGLVPGFVGGYLAGHLDGTDAVSAGFLGAVFAGLMAGYLVNFVKQAPAPKYIKPIMPILIIPIVCSLIVGGVMLKVVGPPIADLMRVMGLWLATLRGGNAIVLGAILGAMIAFDMGGPVNKTAFFFGAAMIKEGNFYVMGACAAAICTPPLGLGLATLLNRKVWTEEQRESGVASLAMGMIGITEGAIPFAAADPVRVIPCIMAGSMVAGVIAMLGHVEDHAPHGGPIVLPVIANRLAYIAAIVAGTLVTAVSINLVKTYTSKAAATP